MTRCHTIMRILITAVGFLFFVMPRLRLGCDCRLPSSACAFVKGATVAFLGKVVFTNHEESGSWTQSTLIHFEVEEAFKGLAPGTRSVWIDPGSFTSCYAEYELGQRYLVFARSGFAMPQGVPMMSVFRDRSKLKPIPPGFDLKATVFLAPECSGTRRFAPESRTTDAFELDYLRRYKAGRALPMVAGMIRGGFGLNDYALSGVTVTLTGN